MTKVSARECRNMIGKIVSCEFTRDANRGLYKELSGKVLDVQGNNILIDVLGSADWYWIPFISYITVKEA